MYLLNIFWQIGLLNDFFKKIWFENYVMTEFRDKDNFLKEAKGQGLLYFVYKVYKVSISIMNSKLLKPDRIFISIMQNSFYLSKRSIYFLYLVTSI